MADTFRLDYVGTKAGIKSASVVMGFLETGMRVLDSASGLVSRLQELAVLGANATNTAADSAAIDAEFDAITNELDRLLENATYKGKAVFGVEGAYAVSLGGRGAEMKFGLGDVLYSDEYAKLSMTETKIDYQHTLTSTAVGAAAFGTGSGANSGVTAAAAGVTETNTDATTNPTDEVAYSELRSGSAGAYVHVGTGPLVDASDGVTDTDKVTKIIEDIQAKLNTARVQAGSQYAAIESAINYTTDLTAQYELGYNTVSDVNFSMETAHLAKNQILQQAATAMLAQANQGQQGLLQLLS
jgi:flagellin